MRRRNPTAEDQLLRYIWHIVSKSVRSEQDREDVVHDAVEEFYETFDPAKSERWQTQAGFAAQHAVRNYFRRRSGIRYVPQEYQGSATISYEEQLRRGPRQEPVQAVRLPYTRPAQESALETEELLSQVALLTPKERKVIEQHLRGYSWTEIAQATKVSPQAVLKTKDRAMKKLRAAVRVYELLEAEGE